MNSEIYIQSVKTKDEIISVAELAAEIWPEHYTPIIGKAQVDYMFEKYQTAEAMAEQLGEGYNYFLIKEGDTTRGYFSTLLKEDSLFLSKFYVHKSARGKGLGKKAIRYMNKLAIESGKSVISLTVNKHNSNSIEAYKKMGFEIIRPMVTDIGSGYVMDDYYMEKKL